MSFKSDIDDVRSSLSYKLKKILEFKSKQVYCADRFVNDKNLVDENFLINECDLIIISAAHSHYKHIESTANVIDLWNITGKGIGI